MDDAFNSVMHDLTGKISLESEDPRWSQLFRCKQAFQLRGKEDFFQKFCIRLLEHNLSTGNFITLLEQTASRLRQMMNRKIAPSLQSIEQCCCSLQIAALFMSYFCSHLSASQIRSHCSLPNNWPINRRKETIALNHSQSRQSTSGDYILRALIDDLLGTLQSYPIQTWFYDIVYYSSNLIISMFTTQLYQVEDFMNYHYHENSFLQGDNLFMDYIFNHTDNQYQQALIRSEHDVSGTMAGRLVRSLLSHISEGANPPRDSLVHSIAKHHTAMNPKVGMSGSLSTLPRGVDSRVFALQLHNQGLLHPLQLLSNAVNMPAQVLNTLLNLVTSSFHSTVSILSLPIPFINRWMATSGHPSTPSATTSVLPVAHPDTSQSTGVNANNSNRSNPKYSLKAGNNTRERSQPRGSFTIPEKARQILLLLLYNQRKGNGLSAHSTQTSQSSTQIFRQNVIRECFCNLFDEDEDQTTSEEQPGSVDRFQTIPSHVHKHESSSGKRIYLSFQGIVQSINRDLPNESTALLLYSLLQMHPMFLDNVIQSGSAASLLNSVLRSLHISTTAPSLKPQSSQNTSNRQPDISIPSSSTATCSWMNTDHVYVLMSCVLLMSQEISLRSQLFATVLTPQEISWYSDRNLGQVSLGSILLLVLLRISLLALFRSRDSYLLSNCLTGILSLAASSANLDHQISERIITVIVRLMRRVIKAQSSPSDPYNGYSSAPQTPTLKPTVSSSSSTATARTDSLNNLNVTASSNNHPQRDSVITSGDAVRQMAEISDTLKTLLLFVGASLRPQKRESNIRLLYSLLLLDSKGELSQSLIHPIITHLFHPHPQLVNPQNHPINTSSPWKDNGQNYSGNMTIASLSSSNSVTMTSMPPNLSTDNILRSPSFSIAAKSTSLQRASSANASQNQQSSAPSSSKTTSTHIPITIQMQLETHKEGFQDDNDNDNNNISSPLSVIAESLSRMKDVLWPYELSLLIRSSMISLQRTGVNNEESAPQHSRSSSINSNWSKTFDSLVDKRSSISIDTSTNLKSDEENEKSGGIDVTIKNNQSGSQSEDGSSLAIPAIASEAVELLRKSVILDLQEQLHTHGSSSSSRNDSPENCLNASYLYEEGDQPELFFIPHIWSSTIGGSQDCTWYGDRIAILDPSSIPAFILNDCVDESLSDTQFHQTDSSTSSLHDLSTPAFGSYSSSMNEKLNAV